MRINKLYELESTDLRIADLIAQAKYYLSIGIRFVVTMTLIGFFTYGGFVQSAEHITINVIMDLVTLGILYGLYNSWRGYASYKQALENIRKET